MNIFVVIACFALIGLTLASTEEDEKKHQIQIEECLALSGLDRAQMELIKTEGVIKDEPKTAVYMFCAFKKSGILNENFEYGVESMKVHLTKKFSEEVATKIIEECTKDQFEDGPETALHLLKCYLKHAPKKV